MKKASTLILKILLGLFLFLVLVLFTGPLLFKGKIKNAVENAVNESLNAKASIGDYKIGFFKSFPDLTLSLKDFSISGTGKFESDTLARCKSLNLAFNLRSLFKNTGYEVRSVIIDNASVKALILDDGTANWDIIKESETSGETETAPSSVKILLSKVELNNSTVLYMDHEGDMKLILNGVNGSLTGDLTETITNLKIKLQASDLTFLMEDFKYLDRVTADADIDLKADLDSMKFILQDNHILINDLKLNLAGMVAMPSDDIETDLSFNTGQSSFKSILSLVPAFYMEDFEELRADGSFSMEGTAIGVYSDADSTMPDVTLKISVNDGLISYPSLPEKISNININTDLFVDGKDLDKTKVDVSNFHMELAGNPFDMQLALKTPVSDPDFKGMIAGKLDLGALSGAIPLDSMSLSGLIDVSVKLAGRMSFLEKEQYEKFQASGIMNISKMGIALTGYPEVQIERAGFEFSPASAVMNDSRIRIGKNSDFQFSGKLENYIPYVFDRGTIKGKLSLHSGFTDLDEIMSGMISDTTLTDTTALEVIKIPGNIDFAFDAIIEKFVYNKMEIQNIKGIITVEESVLKLRNAGMDFFGGRIGMTADYDTRDSLKPRMKAELNMENIGIKDAFNSFNSIRQLAPTAKGINGRVGIKLSYSSLLGNDFMPVISSISGGGKLTSDEVTLVESAAYNKVRDALKLGDRYSNIFKDLNISFKIADGRIIVSPFSTRVGNVKMKINGDQGIDQTINYIVKTEIPRAELGSSVNSLIDNLSTQAASFGLTYKPADILKVNIKVSGTFLKPVVAPFFGNEPADSSSATGGVKEIVKNVVDEQKELAREKVKEEAVQQADKLVAEAEEKGQILRQEAAKSAERIIREADTQAEKLIKEAEPKGAIARLAAQRGADTMKKEASKKADLIMKEADEKANKMVEEAKAKREEMLNKI